jgi:hypothetical protein
MMLLVHFVVVNSKKKETERRIDTIKILSRCSMFRACGQHHNFAAEAVSYSIWRCVRIAADPGSLPAPSGPNGASTHP